MSEDIKLTPKPSTTICVEDWYLREDDSNPYLAPELRQKVLVGRVYGHPKFEDGKIIRTSSLRAFDLSARSATTRNTSYYLGAPKQDYAEKYPEAMIGMVESD